MISKRFLLTLPILWASVAMAQSAGNANAVLSGEYTFYLKGSVANAKGAAPDLVAIAGAFRADGQGHITSGVLDQNNGSGVVQVPQLAGTYQLDTTGKGSVILTSGTTSFGFSFYTAAPLPATLALASIVAGTGSLLNATGQLAPSIKSPISQGSTPYLFTLNGQTATGEVQDFGNAALTFTPVQANSGQVTGQGTEIVDGSTSMPFSGVTGTYAAPDPTTGRFTMALHGFGSGGNPATAQNFVTYEGVFPSGVLIFLSTDPAPAPLLIGTAFDGY